LGNWAQDGASLSCFSIMGSNKASGIEANEFWYWLDGLNYWYGGSIDELIIDNGFPLVWNLNLYFSHGWPP
jgi:uncharacterized membrane protein YeiH